MDNTGMTFRESIFMFVIFMALGGFMTCSLALNAIAASLPYILLAAAGSVCLLLVTVSRCYAMIGDARARRYYLENYRGDYIEAGCREVNRYKLLTTWRRK